MSCINSCLIGSGFLGSMIFTMFSTTKSKYNKEFNALLNDQQRNRYEIIVKERFRIYIEGYILGLICATILVISFNKIPKNSKICLFITTAIGINYLYYSVYPKSDYIINHLNSVEQNKAWLKIYVHMKHRCKIGFLLGILGYLFLGKAFCN